MPEPRLLATTAPTPSPPSDVPAAARSLPLPAVAELAGCLQQHYSTRTEWEEKYFKFIEAVKSFLERKGWKSSTGLTFYEVGCLSADFGQKHLKPKKMEGMIRAVKTWGGDIGVETGSVLWKGCNYDSFILSPAAPSQHSTSDSSQSPTPPAALPPLPPPSAELTEEGYSFNDSRFANWNQALKDSTALARKRAHDGLLCPFCFKRLKTGNGDGFTIWTHVNSVVGTDELHGDKSWWTSLS